MDKKSKIAFWVMCPAAALYGVALTITPQWGTGLSLLAVAAWWAWFYRDSRQQWEVLARETQAREEIEQMLQLDAIPWNWPETDPLETLRAEIRAKQRERMRQRERG